MTVEQSKGHISFGNGYEYFWSKDESGKKIVVKAALFSPIDPSSKQRVGARFEGTESWFARFGTTLISSNASSENNRP